MPKKKITLTLNEETIKILDEYKKQYGLPSRSAVLDKIILSNSISDDLVNSVVDAFDTKYKNTFTRIRLASNAADMNTQVLVEAINSLLYYFNATDRYVNTSDSEAPVITQARKSIKDKIAYFKMLKDSKNLQKK